MSVGGEYSFAKISLTQLEHAGKQFGVDADTACEIVHEVRSGVVEAFESARPLMKVQGSAAMGVADDLLKGLRSLPFVLS